MKFVFDVVAKQAYRIIEGIAYDVDQQPANITSEENIIEITPQSYMLLSENFGYLNGLPEGYETNMSHVWLKEINEELAKYGI